MKRPRGAGISAFESLAQRLEALTAAKRPPWRWLRFAD
jgi:hypothetical protein